MALGLNNGQYWDNKVECGEVKEILKKKKQLLVVIDANVNK